jgi:hypothetical protein
MIETILVNEEEYSFTHHALTVINERELSIEWIIATLNFPEKTEMDSNDIQLIHALKRIPEYNHRVLRVIYNYTTTPKRIVITYFDRGQKNHL